jgi:hypothetical protein
MATYRSGKSVKQTPERTAGESLIVNPRSEARQPSNPARRRRSIRQPLGCIFD